MYAWEHIQQTIDYIETHLCDKLEVNKLADLAHLSPFYYQRLFSKMVKKPVMEYIRLRRLAKSLDLLQQPERRILDIAMAVGFSSHEQFTRSFKKTFLMTPVAYRRHPIALNRMNKPELALNYIVVNKGVPLVTDGMVLEIEQRSLTAPEHFAGFVREAPDDWINGLGVESGADPLDEVWQTLHQKKKQIPWLSSAGSELGVAFPGERPGSFSYFAGAKVELLTKEVSKTPSKPVTGAAQIDNLQYWTLLAGEYIVVSFEAESFEDLVMDALYKAQRYLFDVWLPHHQLTTEPYCVEYYSDAVSQTAAMEIWVKPLDEPFT